MKKINCLVCLPVFLHTNDVHACFNAVESFEVFLIILLFNNFTFLFSSLAIIALLEHNNQCCDNVTHIIIYLNHFAQQNYFKIPKVSEYSPKFPIFPQNSQYSRWKFTALKIPGNFASLHTRGVVIVVDAPSNKDA